MHSLTTALIGVVAFALILYRQLRARPVNEATGARRPVIFGAVGVLLAGDYLLERHVTTVAVAGLLVSLVVGAGLSYLRGHTVRLWRQDGVWWRRGTAVTLVLWFCSIGAQVGIDALLGRLDPSGSAAGLGNATLLLYLGISLGLQHLVVVQRVRARDDAAQHGAATVGDVSRAG